MLNPTKDKYLLCIDLIEDCESACKIALAASNKIYFSIEERKAIAKMLDKFTECDSKFWEEEERASMQTTKTLYTTIVLFADYAN